MKKLLILCCVAAVAFINFASLADTADRIKTGAALREGLVNAKNASDSIKILYDVFDVLPRNERIPVARELYAIAKNAGETEIQLDVCRLLSTCFEDVDTLRKIVVEVERMPRSRAQKETILFIKMRGISYKARRLSEDERQKEIVKMIHHYETKKPGDDIDDFLDLYRLVEFLRHDVSGDMLNKYLERLVEMQKKSQFGSPAIESVMWAEVSNIYSDAFEPEKAVQATLNQLDALDRLEKQYRDNGRKYRHYELSRYVAYRRLLRNYRALRPGEAEKYYRLAEELARKNPDVAKDMETNPRIHAYYAMATGDYAGAVKQLQDVVKRPNSLPAQKQFLEMLVEASEKTGDERTRLEALTAYVSILNELNEHKAMEKSRELSIQYDLQDLKTRNTLLETENRESQIDKARSLMTLVSVAFVIIFFALLFMLVSWSRYQKNTTRMGIVTDNMHRERHALRKSLYLDNYEALDPLAQLDEDTPGWQKRMREQGEKRGDATLFMTESIITDLLYIAWAGHADLIKHIVNTSVDAILRRAESLGRENSAPDARILVEYPADDFTVNTDSECVSAVLGHIFRVATEYAPESQVVMKAEKAANDHLDFVITIEGAEPANINGPQILQRMRISEILLRHKNSGLYVCRMISMLMQSRIIPDKTYAEGARYRFRTPMKMEK